MRIEKSKLTVFTPLDDGTGVLLNKETLLYFSLNRSGVALWQELDRSGPVTIDDLVRATCDRFDVSEEDAQKQIETFLNRLEQFQMIRAV